MFVHVRARFAVDLWPLSTCFAARLGRAAQCTYLRARAEHSAIARADWRPAAYDAIRGDLRSVPGSLGTQPPSGPGHTTGCCLLWLLEP